MPQTNIRLSAEKLLRRNTSEIWNQEETDMKSILLLYEIDSLAHFDYADASRHDKTRLLLWISSSSTRGQYIRFRQSHQPGWGIALQAIQRDIILYSAISAQYWLDMCVRIIISVQINEDLVEW